MRGLVLAAVFAAAVGAPPVPAETLVGEGVIQSDEKVALRTLIFGVIKSLPAREGTVCAKGATLVELESQVQRAQVEAAEAEVRRADAAVMEAEVTVAATTREYERNRLVHDLITEKELALSRDAMLSARSALGTRQEEALKANKQLEVARENLALTVIPAPFDGLVTRVYLREGDTPKPSEMVVLDFVSLDKLSVEVGLPLAYLRRVTPRMPVRLDVESDNPAIRVSTAGHVEHIYPETDPVTRMFRVKISVPKGGGGILPGLFTKVRFDLPGRGR